MSSVAVTTLYDYLGLTALLECRAAQTNPHLVNTITLLVGLGFLPFVFTNSVVLLLISHPSRETGVILTPSNLCAAHFLNVSLHSCHLCRSSGPPFHAPGLFQQLPAGALSPASSLSSFSTQASSI